MRKLVLWQKVLLVFIALLFLGAGLSYYFYRNYQDDRTPTVEVNLGIMSFRGAVTKLEVASANMKRATSVVRYISRCKRFPESFQGFYEPIKGDKPEDCEPLKVLGKRHNWLDPWDRPYQIRYDRERRKLQIRSLGRYWWWPWDNIEDETNFAVPTDLVEPERQKCDRGEDCIYSRGWH